MVYNCAVLPDAAPAGRPQQIHIDSLRQAASNLKLAPTPEAHPQQSLRVTIDVKKDI